MVGACQQNSGIFLVRGGGAGLAAGRNRVASGRDGSGQMLGRGRCRGVPRLGWQRKNHRLGARCRRRPRLGRQRARSEMPVVPRLGSERNLQGPGRRQPNQLKRKRSIIFSSNSGFSKSFSLVMIKLLCSQNPTSW